MGRACVLQAGGDDPRKGILRGSRCGAKGSKGKEHGKSKTQWAHARNPAEKAFAILRQKAQVWQGQEIGRRKMAMPPGPDGRAA
jgi:hypothetical protein